MYNLSEARWVGLIFNMVHNTNRYRSRKFFLKVKNFAIGFDQPPKVYNHQMREHHQDLKGSKIVAYYIIILCYLLLTSIYLYLYIFQF
jgi:hypothetical protein